MDEKTFERYLMEVHAKQYQGVDDDMLDDFHSWRESLSSGEMNQICRNWALEQKK